MLWWTLQNVVIAAVLAGLAWSAGRLFRIGPVARHALWLIVLAKLLTPPLVVWPWAIRGPLGDAPRKPADPHCRVAQSVAPPVGPPSPAAADSIDLSLHRPDPGYSAAPTEEPLPNSPVPAAVVSIAARPRWEAWVLPAAAGVWLAGGLGLAVLQGVRVARMLRRARRAAPPDAALVRRVADTAARMGMKPVAVRVVDGIGSPAVWAVGRPELLWPADLPENLSDDSLGGLIVHELAHLKRRDHWVGWLELAGGCLWWWNPLFWYVRHQLRENAELACDAWVVQTLPRGRRAYAEGLIAVCEWMSGRVAPTPALGVGTGGRRFLERRLAMILRDRVPLRLPRGGLLAVALVGLSALPAWSQKSPGDETKSTEVPVLLADPAAGGVAQRTTVIRRFSGTTAAPAAALPKDAQDMLDQYYRSEEAARREMERAMASQRQQLIAQLQQLQDRLAREGKLDEAVAVRDRIRQLQRNDGLTVTSPAPSAYAPVTAVRPDPGTLVEFRDRVGQSILFEVVGSTGGSVWGTNVYTDDSTLAAAAVHAGILRVGERGLVRVTLLRGPASFNGSTRNGVTSSDYGTWPNAYRVAAVRPAPGRSGILRPVPPTPVTPAPITLDSYRGQNGRTFTFEVVGATEGTIWGDGEYTDDSPVAVAAVHAGVLRPGQRGTIRVTILPGRERYEGTTRHGVKSSDYASWGGSYRIEGGTGPIWRLYNNLDLGNRGVKEAAKEAAPAVTDLTRSTIEERPTAESTGSTTTEKR